MRAILFHFRRYLSDSLGELPLTARCPLHCQVGMSLFGIARKRAWGLLSRSSVLKIRLFGRKGRQNCSGRVAEGLCRRVRYAILSMPAERYVAEVELQTLTQYGSTINQICGFDIVAKQQNSKTTRRQNDKTAKQQNNITTKRQNSSKIVEDPSLEEQHPRGGGEVRWDIH